MLHNLYIICNPYNKLSIQKIPTKMKHSGADEVDMDQVMELARKKYRTLKDKPRKLMRVQNFLKQRGFDWEIISMIMSRLKYEFDDDDSHNID
jgi:SOS response regulatory protein OraA/RecX